VAKEEYGRLLTRLRARRGLSVYALARKAGGLHPMLVTRSEAGSRVPDEPAEVFALAEALELGDDERDGLLVAAGFWPAAFLALGPDDATLRAVAAVLTAPAIDEAARRQFGAGVEALAGALLGAAGVTGTRARPARARDGAA
jgi:transcriptional regulator with XRE-family HTH domain